SNPVEESAHTRALPTRILGHVVALQRDGHVRAQGHLRADESRIKVAESISQHSDRLALSETGKYVPAPPSEMHCIQSDVRPRSFPRLHAEQIISFVERSERCATAALRCVCLSTGGGQPRLQDARH